MRLHASIGGNTVRDYTHPGPVEGTLTVDLTRCREVADVGGGEPQKVSNGGLLLEVSAMRRAEEVYEVGCSVVRVVKSAPNWAQSIHSMLRFGGIASERLQLLPVFYNPQTGHAIVGRSEHVNLYANAGLQIKYGELKWRIPIRPGFDPDSARIRFFDITRTGGRVHRFRCEDFVFNNPLPSNPEPKPRREIGFAYDASSPKAYVERWKELATIEFDPQFANELAAMLRPLDRNGFAALLAEGGPLSSTAYLAIEKYGQANGIEAIARDDLLRAAGYAPQLFDLLSAEPVSPEVREAAIELVRKSNHTLPLSVVKIAATFSDEQLNPKLERQFVLRWTGREPLLPLFRMRPGIDLEVLIEKSWQRARVGMAAKSDVAFEAARLGHLDAFDAALDVVEGIDKSASREMAARLASLVDGPDGPEALAAWLSANRSKFRFDSNTQQFTVPAD